jgi:hypothetical protein
MSRRTEINEKLDAGLVRILKHRLTIAVDQLVPFAFNAIQKKVLNEVLTELSRNSFLDGCQFSLDNINVGNVVKE